MNFFFGRKSIVHDNNDDDNDDGTTKNITLNITLILP